MNIFKRLFCSHEYKQDHQAGCIIFGKCIKCGKEKKIYKHKWTFDKMVEYFDPHFGPAVKYFYRCTVCGKLENRTSL